MNWDNRKDGRHDKFLIAEYKQKGNRGGYSLGTVRNLSPEGFSLETQVFHFERGEVLEFRLTHSRTAPAVEITGEVVWKKQAWFKYISGIRILNAAEDTEGGIEALIAAAGEDWNYTGSSDETPENVLSQEDRAPSPLQEEERPQVLSPAPSTADGREGGELPEPFSIPMNEKDRKSTLYAALAAFVIFLLLVVPAVVKKVITSGESLHETDLIESPADEADDERAATAADSIPDRSPALPGSPAVPETRTSLTGQTQETNRGGAVIAGEGKGAKSLKGAAVSPRIVPGKDVAGTPGKKDFEELIARMDRTLESVREIEEKEQPGVSGALPEEDRRAGAGTFSEKWVRVGSVREGIPLFIDTANMSSPDENIVKMLVRTIDEEKEFIDLVEIDCARSLLRVIDELNSNNPATSAYSREWRAILPESMVLRDAACSVQD